MVKLIIKCNGQALGMKMTGTIRRIGKTSPVTPTT
jgi:hypothetical protein